jgi:hypothetical protein
MDRDIATIAVAHKMDAKTDPAVKALGAEMHQASTGAAGAANQAKERAVDDEIDKTLVSVRANATAALTALQAKATPATIADAQAKRRALRQEITKVEQRYADYRAIPFEVDAHQVGEAENQTFKEWRR